IGGETRGDEALVHAVPRHRVDQPCRIADEERAAAADARAGPPQRQPVAAQPRERLWVDRVSRADPPQVFADAPALALPGANADVRVVAFREDPAVPARDVAELDDRTPRVALARNRCVRGIALE